MFRTLAELLEAIRRGELNVDNFVDPITGGVNRLRDPSGNLKPIQPDLDVLPPPPSRVEAGIPQTREQALAEIELSRQERAAAAAERAQFDPDSRRVGNIAPGRRPDPVIQPGLFPAPPPRMAGLADVQRATPVSPTELPGPVPRRAPAYDYPVDVKTPEGEQLLLSYMVKVSPEFVRSSLIQNFENAQTPEELSRALNALVKVRRVIPRVDSAQGRMAVSGVGEGRGGEMLELGGGIGEARQIIPESGVSIRGSSQREGGSSFATGRTSLTNDSVDNIGLAQVETAAIEAARRLEQMDMLPDTMKPYKLDPLLKEVTAAAESAEAALRPSDRAVRLRFIQRASGARSVQAINRVYDEVMEAVKNGTLNRLDAEEIRKTVEMKNTRFVREIFSTKSFPTGLALARRAAKRPGIFEVRAGEIDPSANPTESMFAAIATARSREELMSIRDIYQKMGKGAIDRPSMEMLSKALARQLARIELSDIDLQRFFGYTDWVYVTKGGIERGTPGAVGMERFSEVAQEVPFPVAIRGILKGEEIRNTLINLGKKRRLYEDNVSYVQRNNLAVKGFEDFDVTGRQAELDDINWQISNLQEYGVGKPGELDALRIRKMEIERELQDFDDAADEAVYADIDKQIESGIERQEAKTREKEPTQGASGRDKYMDESESDFLLRVMGRDGESVRRSQPKRRMTDAAGEAETGIREVAGGRPIMGQLQSSQTQKELDEVETAIESAIQRNAISEDVALRVMEAVDEHRAAIEGSAVWRGRPDRISMDTAAPLDPVPPSEFGNVAVTPFNKNNPSSYDIRTQENAQLSDITIAVADSFDTGGEFLTRNYARINGKDYDTSYIFSPDMLDDVDHIVESMNRVFAAKGQPIVINGAGNGISNMPEGITQNDVNNYIGRLLEMVMSHPNRRFEVLGLRTGGQSGADIAWGHAARRLQLPVRIHPAYGSYGGIMVRLGEGFGYKGKPTAFLKKEEYLRSLGFDRANDPYTFDYKMQTGGKEHKEPPRSR